MDVQQHAGNKLLVPANRMRGGVPSGLPLLAYGSVAYETHTAAGICRDSAATPLLHEQRGALKGRGTSSRGPPTMRERGPRSARGN